MVRFIHALQDQKAAREEEILEQEAYVDVGIEDDEIEEDVKFFGCLTFEKARLIWLISMSFIHWFNLIVTPFVMLWPQNWPQTMTVLWLVEICFLFDIIRKCVVRKPKSYATDFYDIFIEYL